MTNIKTPSALVNRLRETASKGVSVWGDLQMEAANEIEILTAEREAYASAMDRMQSSQPVAQPRDFPIRADTDDAMHDALTTGTGIYRQPITDGEVCKAFGDKSRIDFARALIETQYVIPVAKPLKSSEIVTMYAEQPTCDADMIEFAREIEKAHGITEKAREE